MNGPRAFAADAEFSEDEHDNRQEVFASDAERISKYKDTEKRFGKCPICKMFHTYRRKLGDEVLDWPSERLGSCPKFMSYPMREKVENLERHGLCPRCMAWNKHDRDKCPVKG